MAMKPNGFFLTICARKKPLRACDPDCSLSIGPDHRKPLVDIAFIESDIDDGSGSSLAVAFVTVLSVQHVTETPIKMSARRARRVPPLGDAYRRETVFKRREHDVQ